MSDRLLLSPEILELSQASKVFMTLKMVILTTNTNLNGTRFTEDFIDGICTNQKDFQGIALVVNRARLEKEQFDNLTHEFNGQTLETDMIGSFVGFEKAENADGSKSLIGEARIMKRFPKTCNAISELYSTNELSFSCEVLVRRYDNVEDNYREVNYHDGLNSLMANCIVSQPAEVDAKPTLLVASVEEDLIGIVDEDVTNISNGGANMALTLEKRKNVSELASKVNFIEAMDGLMGEDVNLNSNCCFWVGEDSVFEEYLVAQESQNGSLYMFDYSVNEDVLEVSNPRKAKFELVEDAEQVLASISKKTSEIKAELDSKDVEIASLQTAKEEVELQLEAKTTELSTLQTEKQEVEQELSNVKEQVQLKDEALSTTELQANEKIIQLGEVVEGLKDKLKTIEPIVEEYNKVQEELAEKAKADKQQELIKYALSSKMISENEISENEEIKLAIAELDEVKIKSIVADRIVKNNIELNNIKTEEELILSEDVVISASNTKDLIEPSLEEKYGL